MVTYDVSVVKQRIKLRTYRPHGRPQLIACITFRDPILGTVARSERSVAGILTKPPAIAWEANVIDQLAAHKVDWLEVWVTDALPTYFTPLTKFITMAKPRNGQLAMLLAYWDYTPPFAMPSVTVHVDSDKPQQMTLFEATNEN